MGNEETNNKHYSNDDTAIASMKQSHTSDPNFPYTKHKRKGSDSNRISQEATTQYFNNLGHSQLHPQPQCPFQKKKDETTTSNNDEPNKQMTKVIMSSQLNSNSVMNDTIMNSDNNNVIGSNPHHNKSTSSLNNNTHNNNLDEINEGLTQAFKKEYGLSPKQYKNQHLSTNASSSTFRNG